MAHKRSLYQCGNARVKDSAIYCAAGHNLNAPIGMRQLVRGEPLEMRTCQKCQDFDDIGAHIPEKERGWIRSERR